MVGRGARAYDGVTFEGGSDGECAMGIDNVRERHFGNWGCKILTVKSSGSSVQYGKFKLEDEGDRKTSRLGSQVLFLDWNKCFAGNDILPRRKRFSATRKVRRRLTSC